MKVLVTGSSGRVGSEVVSRLLERGHDVRGVDIRASGRVAERFQEMEASLDDADAMTSATAGIDIVLHLGAFMSWAPAGQAQMFRVNVDGTRCVLDAAAGSGVSRVVFASTGEVYPENSPEFLPVTEDHPLKANSPYGLGKILGEEMVRYHQRRDSFETVILRFSHTQNANELLDESSFFSGPRFFLDSKIQQQENFGNHSVVELLRSNHPGTSAHVLACNEDGRAYQMHITDTRDMGSGVLLAMQSSEAVGQTFNLGASDPVDFEILLGRMSTITGYPVVRINLPGPGVYYHTSNDRIRKRLGFEPQWRINRMLDEAALSWQSR